MPQLEKQLNQLFLNTGTAMARAGKTEENSIDLEPVTVERNYIDMKETVIETTGFNVTSNYPYVAQIGDEIYDYLFREFYSMELTQGVTTGIRVFQQPDTLGTGNLAWQFDAKITITNYNMATGIITFDLTHSNIVLGSATVDVDGLPIFTPAP